MRKYKMEITIDVNELRKRKIMVCVPMYGGMCSGMFTKSIADLSIMATSYGVEIKYFFLFNESLIPRARNYLADEFMRNTDYTHLMFIDGDIGFDCSDVLSLAALSDPDGDKDIVCGPYPKKAIAWEKIKRAVDKGVADVNPNELERFVGDYVFNPVGGVTEIKLDEPVEVMESGTGFMMIQRSALEKYQAEYPEFMYKPDHIRTASFDGSRKIMAFFDCVIDNKYTDIRKNIMAMIASGEKPSMEELQALIDLEDDGGYSERYLSEDYMFCQWARKAGLKIWLCPWMKLVHMGSYNFGGSLVDLANIGAGATADPKEIANMKV